MSSRDEAGKEIVMQIQNVVIDIYQQPVLLSIDLIYRVCQYLRGDVPLSYLRDWTVDMRLNSKMLSNADSWFLQMFEGRYAEYCDFPAPSSDARDADEFFKMQLHELIGAPALNFEQTGTQQAGGARL